MDKKRALICSLILCGIGLIAFITEMAGQNVFPKKLIGLLTVFTIMFLLGGIIMLIVYARLKKKEAQSAINNSARDYPPYDEEEFRQWLQKFDPFVRMGARLTETHEKTFSKFGGLPLVPDGFVWPTNGNRLIPFLLQIDFAEINSDGGLGGFPSEGLLYLFADSDEINEPTFERGEEEYAQGRAFQFLFFDSADRLTTPTKPDALETVYKEFNVAAETVKTYPDTDDCKEAFDIYCDRPFGGADDGYDELQGENMDVSMLGGWATYVQCSRFASDYKLDPDEWVLLMQIASVADDEKFMWGDSGMLYFYIRKDDLLARRFDNVKMDMQCY